MSNNYKAVTKTLVKNGYTADVPHYNKYLEKVKPWAKKVGFRQLFAGLQIMGIIGNSTIYPHFFAFLHTIC